MATQLAEPRTRHFPQPQQATAHLPATFDLDAFHAMQARDDQLVAQRAAHGVAGELFVYKFSISGTIVSGISVDGAQQLAYKYGGIRHRIVATIEKNGAVFQFRSYPNDNVPMSVSVNVVQELAAEDDFYSCIVEVADIKSGNSFQVEKSENRFEQRRDGTYYERPNFQIIAQSKARRNGILLLVPGDVQEAFKAKSLAAGQTIDIGSDVFQAKYAGVTKFAAAKGIAIDRRAIEQLTLDQISGLGEAAHNKDVEAFRGALDGLGLTSATDDPITNPDSTVYPESGPDDRQDNNEPPKRRGRPPGSTNRPKPPTAVDQAGRPPEGETIDQRTGEVATATDEPRQGHQLPFEE